MMLDEFGTGLSGLEKLIGAEYARSICEKYPSQDLYIYKQWDKNRRLLAIVSEQVVRDITRIYGGGMLALPKGSKWILEKRNMAILKDRENMTIPAIVQKYGLSKAAIYTILRLEKAKQNQRN